MLKIALPLIPKCIKLGSIASFGYHIDAIAQKSLQLRLELKSKYPLTKTYKNVFICMHLS